MIKLNGIITRSVSGIVFVLIIVGSLFSLPRVFGVVFGLAMLFVLQEFHKLTNRQKGVKVQWLLGLLGASLLFVLSYFNASKMIGAHFLLIYLFFLFFVFIIELFRKSENPINNLAYFIMGQIYIALPFSILNYIYYMSFACSCFSGIGNLLILAMFIALWTNDVGAYIVGSTFGKYKLFERISPKKTWEGFLGGLLLTIVLALNLSFFIPQLSFIQWLIFTQIVSIFGTLGDLIESMLKRTVGVKDSGSIMPGHGGLLDRLDSMIFVVPIILIYLTFILK